MTNLVSPHGAQTLKPLLLPEGQRAQELGRAEALTKVPMSSSEVCDLLLLSMGAYTPLDGFMGEQDWQGVCNDMKLSDGLFWPIPVTLSAEQALADQIELGEEIALIDGETQQIMAVMTVAEKFAPDLVLQCKKVFGTNDESHPGVAKVMAQPPVNLGGSVKVIEEGWFPEEFSDLYIRPDQARKMFEDMGWSKVAAFQTRNPMHRSHEHLVKIAIDVTDGVFIHQVLGKLKPGDIPAPVRVEAINAMIENYFAPNRAIQAGYPIEMRYAGPREALFHALIRQNFGCSHLIVGRDHAGVGDFYGPFDAHDIFDTLWEGALETQPLKIDITFYCKKCDGMATAKTCPHDEEFRINISGTRQREMLANGEDIPTEFSRPEVVAVLRKFYEN
ncbi:MAG: sulfate adenylyltransferase [Rhodospirillaceae bacterium]|jgi:sulfate adenylyltransferase|nr:sulfate adenylyltransferase [Rhodospirillaceae bacterium]MBT4939544.1 sulfate adenylyltransferase [Rhodospirillaceae bacterium]MBT5938379.1 sulfate adenylyltransferase [Rhodospirillaceae bacterium]MBT7265418.1 sulfate adenylyltransferase [Rhodospirillaceae bacterium]